MEERFGQVDLELLLVKVRRALISAAQEVEARRYAYVVVELDARVARASSHVVANGVVEGGREVIALAADGRHEFALVDGAAAVGVHHEEGLELVVQVDIEIVELAERDLAVAVGVVLGYEQLHGLHAELACLCGAQRLLQLDGRDRAVAVLVHFAEHVAQIVLHIPCNRRSVSGRRVARVAAAAASAVEMVVVVAVGCWCWLIAALCAVRGGRRRSSWRRQG